VIKLNEKENKKIWEGWKCYECLRNKLGELVGRVEGVK
jgi:hypothetical protein